MAKIRIVDEWLRSPVSAPSRHRAILVVAESWSEQRVLMRAFAASTDQTRPTIHLHGAEIAIGPAGTDPYGQWGIHVEPPVDGRAQELRAELELAARRLAGSKGRPPRLVDEEPAFETKATHLWKPGTPPDVPASETVFGRPEAWSAPEPGYYEPALVAPPSDSAHIPSAAPRFDPRRTPPFWSQARPAAPPRRSAPHGEAGAGQGRRRRTGRDTAVGFSTAPAARPRPGASFATLVGHTMPIGFALTGPERAVLDALGRAEALTAAEIAALAGVEDGAEWMAQLAAKLADFGLDLVNPGPMRAGEPTYVLRR